MADRVGLNSIKSRIKTILDDANTTTASVIDLSANLSSRVQKVLKTHPDLIPPQASFFPLVTCYIQSKEYVGSDIAVNQLNAKRRSRLEISLVGAVFNENFSAATEDPADEDINYLMENVELVLRTDPSLNGLVKWQKANGTRFYSTKYDQNSSVRTGLLTLEAEVYY